MKFSINFKLMSLVILAVSLLSVSIVAIGTVSSLKNLQATTLEAEEEIALLLAKQFSGNIYFQRIQHMEESFVEFSADPNFHFAYGGAVRLNGDTIAENAKFDNLSEAANKLG